MKLAVKIQFVLILSLQIVQSGTPVKVTFQANAYGVPDTLNVFSTVQIRGNLSPFTWDYTTAGKMKNAGGEYWKLTIQLNSKDTLYYNYFTNAKAAITASDSGWEADISDWGNGKRRLIVGDKDTTLPLEFINGFKNPAGQWGKPFVSDKEDTVVCFLRVNMWGYEYFDSSKHKVGVRGSFAVSNWGTSLIMQPQQPHANVNSRQDKKSKFYIAPIYWKKSYLDSLDKEKTMRYKFVIHIKNAPNNEDWSAMVDNPDYTAEFVMPKKDTIPQWITPKGPIIHHSDTLVLSNYLVSMSNIIKQRKFLITDSLCIDFGAVFFGQGKRIKKMQIVDSSGIFGVKDTLILNYTTPLPTDIPGPYPMYFSYRYVIVKNGISYYESFVDTFTYPKGTIPYRRYTFSWGKYFVSVFKYDTLSNPSMNQMPVWTNIPSNVTVDTDVPLSFSLSQNYPNPFNPSTMINYQLPTSNLVTLKVFDIVGREVVTLVNEQLEAGSYQTSFNAQGLSSGLYFYQLRAGNYSEVKKMILLK